MLASQLINASFPTISLLDKISVGLQMMDDFDVQHLTILADEKFVGIVSKEDLLDKEEYDTIQTTESSFLTKFVKPTDHFSTALAFAVEFETSIVPVVGVEHELIGVIGEIELLTQCNSFLEADQLGGMIVIELEKRNFSFGEISRLVETNNAVITHLNSTFDKETGMVLVTIKVNKTEISDIVATFQRYDYNLKYFFGEEQYVNELKDNYQNLMTYLNV